MLFSKCSMSSLIHTICSIFCSIINRATNQTVNGAVNQSTFRSAHQSIHQPSFRVQPCMILQNFYLLYTVVWNITAKMTISVRAYCVYCVKNPIFIQIPVNGVDDPAPFDFLIIGINNDYPLCWLILLILIIPGARIPPAEKVPRKITPIVSTPEKMNINEKRKRGEFFSRGGQGASKNRTRVQYSSKEICWVKLIQPFCPIKKRLGNISHLPRCWYWCWC